MQQNIGYIMVKYCKYTGKIMVIQWCNNDNIDVIMVKNNRQMKVKQWQIMVKNCSNHGDIDVIYQNIKAK